MDISPSRSGHVYINGAKMSYFPDYMFLKLGSDVLLEAVLSPGYRFENWSGDVGSTNRVATLRFDRSKFIYAIFSPIVPSWLIGPITAAIIVPLALRWRRRRATSSY